MHSWDACTHHRCVYAHTWACTHTHTSFQTAKSSPLLPKVTLGLFDINELLMEGCDGSDPPLPLSGSPLCLQSPVLLVLPSSTPLIFWDI